MGQALYRKYRSKSLSEIVGQEHIITTLRNALKSGAISHAYLFTGPRGVGKTSIARILAHEVNGLEYNEQTPHIDIIEIDAASNRRIDEIRDLRDKVHIAPTSSKYKVYIIDEVHMLTKEAFNALLKTLEEPPAHVIFILATTEVHKLPETIVSRTQRFTFRSIDREKAVAHMKYIAKQEKITINDEALRLIAEHGEGSFRDSISLLDQVSNMSDKINADDIRAMLGIAPHEVIEELHSHIVSGTPKDIVASLKTTEEKGYEATHIARQLSALVRIKLLDGSTDQPLLATTLLGKLVEVPASSDPATCLEVVLLEANLSANPVVPSVSTRPAPVAAAAAPAVQQNARAAVGQTEQPPTPKPQPVAKKEPAAAPPVPKVTVEAAMPFEQAWPAVLNIIKQKYNTVYGILRMAQPELNGDKVTLAFKFGFHQKRINDNRNKVLITELLGQHLGFPVSLECTVTEAAQPVALDAVSEPTVALAPSLADSIEPGSAPLDTISNIFGGAEVLES